MDCPERAMGKMCGLFGKTRQAWYKTHRVKEVKEMQHDVVLNEVKYIRKKLPRCGLRKLHFMLKNTLQRHLITIGRDRLADLLREHNLLIKRKKGRKTTNSNHHFRRYANTAKDLEIIRIDQLWVCDITYIRTGRNFSYLSLITDAYSRKIVGWSLRDDLTHKGPMEALNMAIKQRTGKLDLTHHSDRGIQYCCDDYVKLLKKNEVTISMTQNGDPYENALAERMNRTLKEEFLQYDIYMNHDQAKQSVARAIKLYNSYRPHMSLDYLTPDQVYYDLEMQRLANPAQLTLFTSPKSTDKGT